MTFDESDLYNIQSNLEGIRYPLFNLAIWKNGLAFKKIDFSETGLPIIKIAELNNGITSSTAFSQGIYGEEVFVKWDDSLNLMTNSQDTDTTVGNQKGMLDVSIRVVQI